MGGHGEAPMTFSRRLRPGIRSGRIRCTIRIWTRLQVKVGGRYSMDDGSVVVDSIEKIRLKDLTDDLARESGFNDVNDLVGVAKHGSGNDEYLIRFHYLAPGAWDVQKSMVSSPSSTQGPSHLLRRIRSVAPRASVKKSSKRLP